MACMVVAPSFDTGGTAGFLREERAAILDDAVAAVARGRVRHYDAAGMTAVRERLEALFDRLEQAAAEHDLSRVTAYAWGVAAERFRAGYDLSEVQAAVNALEEAVWEHVFAELPPADVGEPLRVVSTVLGAVKDVLAREYVALATAARAPALDLAALARGGESRS